MSDNSTASRGGINTDIEVLRGVAVAFVVLCHLPSGLLRQPGLIHSLVEPMDFWGGVDLFFAISGFVIASSLLRQPKRSRFREFAAPFYVRRIFRIWPAALLWLLIPLLASKFFNASGAFGRTHVLLGDTAAASLQVANVYFALCNCGKNYVYWSLSLEEQFYLVFPLLLFFVAGRKLRLALVVLILAQLFLYRPVESMLWMLRTDSIAAGVLIAMLRHEDVAGRFSAAVMFQPESARLLVLALLAGIAWASVTTTTMANAGLLAILSGTCVWLASDDRNIVLRWPSLRRPLLWMGSRSFAIYLVHLPSMWATREILHRLNLAAGLNEHSEPALLVITLVLIAAMSEATYRLVETPLREMGRKLASSLRQDHKGTVPGMPDPVSAARAKSSAMPEVAAAIISGIIPAQSRPP
jgi:peptidoglycan/LPS O-acetylase OafA/YrhL